MSFFVTYTESVVHTVEVDSIPDNEQELMELVTSGSVNSIEYSAYDFEIQNVTEV